MAIWLDRRCDPESTISFAANLPRLRDCLWKLSSEVENVEVVGMQDVLYAAPPEAASRLASVHEIHRQQLSKLPPTISSRWQNRRPAQWPRLSNPVDILQQLEKELGSEVRNKEQVVHDLWPAKNLPPLPLFQRLELLLAGYDLTFRFAEDGGASIIPMPRSPTYSRSVKIPKDKRDQVRKALEQGDPSRAKLENGKLVASWRTHETIRRILNPPATAQDYSRIRYTLKAENQQLGKFVRSMCKQLNLKCTFVDIPDETQNARVSFEVEKATLQTLFATILEPAGLEFELSDSELAVKKRGKAN